jgi:hypothetical protein
MRYFDDSADKYQRLGKVIGDTFSAVLILTLVLIFVQSFLFR